MIQEPDRYVEAFVKAGADMVSVHVEVASHLHRTLQLIREAGAKAGVVLNPATPLGSLDEVLAFCDFVLLMSVNPGFGGQDLIPSVLDKARRLRERVDREGLSVRLEIDGGVTLENLDQVAATGVDMIVAGSAVFGTGDPRSAAQTMVRRLAKIADAAEKP
jgi:ribulose-phosphate 3-epimerase